MKVFVYIATTQGPVLIRRVTQEDIDVQSVVCLDHTAQRLPISDAYHDFVRKGTGVVHQDFGCGSFRLDLADRVTSGDSWQLGVYVAHALAAQGVLVELTANDAGEPGPDDVVVWASGAVRADRSVGQVEQVPQKLVQSAALFAHCAAVGAQLVVLLPEANREPLQETAPSAASVVPAYVGSVAAALTKLEALVADGRHAGEAKPQAGSAASRQHRFAAGALAGLQQSSGVLCGRIGLVAAVVAALLLLAVWWWTPAPVATPIELDDFGGRPAQPGAAQSALRQTLAEPEPVGLGAAMSLLGVRPELTLLIGPRCGDGKAASQTMRQMRLSTSGTTAIPLAGLCRLGLGVNMDTHSIWWVSEDTAQRLTTTQGDQHGQQILWLDTPGDSSRARRLSLIVVPKAQAQAFGERLRRELRRLRFAEFESALPDQVDASLTQMTDNLRRFRLLLTP